MENYRAEPTAVGWQFQRLFGGPDYSDGLQMKHNSLSLAMGYLSLYKIIDNILPLSGTGSADLESAGLQGDSANRFTLGKPKQWGLKVIYIAFPPQPLKIHADIPLVST